MWEQLQQLASSGPGWAAERAQMAMAITEQYQGGGLDRSEYLELMEDLVRSDRLNAEADNIDVKNMLVSAVMAVSALA